MRGGELTTKYFSRKKTTFAAYGGRDRLCEPRHWISVPGRGLSGISLRGTLFDSQRRKKRFASGQLDFSSHKIEIARAGRTPPQKRCAGPGHPPPRRKKNFSYRQLARHATSQAHLAKTKWRSADSLQPVSGPYHTADTFPMLLPIPQQPLRNGLGRRWLGRFIGEVLVPRSG